MQQICNYIECTGCGACEQICAHKAISMQLNDEGFYYPAIDQNTCVDCGLCAKVCPNNAFVQKFEPIPYLAWIKDSTIRSKSSSGGIFSAIASEIISRGGIVCGAAYDEDMTVRHMVVESEEGLVKLRGSKYTQSIIGDVYSRIKEVLKADRWAYFVGTPCQVSGLRNFLRKDYAKLICSDLICHGVPSGELLKEQIHALEKKYNSKIENFDFRAKLRMGQTQDVAITLRKQGETQDVTTKYLNFETLPYTYGFRTNLAIRENCFACKYATYERTGDVTLADFWNVKKFFPEVKRSPGCSLILVSTEKGKQILDAIAGRIVLKETTKDAAISGQAQLQSPTWRPAIRDDYKNYKDFDKYCMTHLRVPLAYKIKKKLANLAKIVTLFKYRY